LAAPVGWVAQYAATKGMRYLADADERWLRVWEPFATLKTPHRYEHVLEHTGTTGSLTIARMVQESASPDGVAYESASWIAIAQDERMEGVAAATCDVAHVFGEPFDLVTMPRTRTGDPAFDRVFATFAPSKEDLTRSITPSVRKLVMGWGIPLHLEVRKGGFILAPVALAADASTLAWLVRSTELFGEKAAKRVG
jgi:hypothetical protein